MQSFHQTAFDELQKNYPQLYQKISYNNIDLLKNRLDEAFHSHLKDALPGQFALIPSDNNDLLATQIHKLAFPYLFSNIMEALQNQKNNSELLNANFQYLLSKNASNESIFQLIYIQAIESLLKELHKNNNFKLMISTHCTNEKMQLKNAGAVLAGTLSFLITQFKHLPFKEAKALFNFVKAQCNDPQNDDTFIKIESIKIFIEKYVEVAIHASPLTHSNNTSSTFNFATLQLLAFLMRKIASGSGGVENLMGNAISSRDARVINDTTNLTYTLGASVGLTAFIIQALNNIANDQFTLDKQTVLNGTAKTNLFVAGVSTTMLGALGHPATAAIMNAVCTAIGFAVVIGSVASDMYDKHTLEGEIHKDLLQVKDLQSATNVYTDALRIYRESILKSAPDQIQPNSCLSDLTNDLGKLLEKSQNARADLSATFLRVLKNLIAYEKQFGEYDYKAQGIEIANTAVQLTLAILSAIPHLGLCATALTSANLGTQGVDTTNTSVAFFQTSQRRPKTATEIEADLKRVLQLH